MRGIERVEHMHGLTHARAMFGTLPAPCGRYGRVFAFRIDDNGRTGPKTQIVDDKAGAFAAAIAAYKADMPVVTVADGCCVFRAAKPEFSFGEWIFCGYRGRRLPIAPSPDGRT